MPKLQTLLLFACAILCSPPRCSAINYSMFIDVEQRNYIVGPATYDARFYIQGNAFSDLALTSPGGINHQNPYFAEVGQSGLSLEELKYSFLGDWTFEETLNGVTKSYSIALPEEVPTALFNTTVPVITSPADNAILGKVFDVTWTNPEPNRATYTYSSNLPFPLRPSISALDTGHFTFDFNGVADYLPTTISDFRIVKRLPAVIINVTPLSSNADARFTGRDISYEVHSPSVSFTVVPESASLLLFGVGMLFATGGRGFVRGDG